MKRLALLFLVMAALAATVIVVLRDPGQPPPAVSEAALAPQDSKRAGQPGPPTAPVASTAPNADPRTPAWLQPDPDASASNPEMPAATANAANAAKLARLGVVMDKLTRLQNQKTIDTTEAAAAIAEVEQINGSPVMSGIRLDVLRENVQVTGQIERAAKELQALQDLEKSQAPASQERTALIRSKAADLAALRSRIRHDVVQAPAGEVSP